MGERSGSYRKEFTARYHDLKATEEEIRSELQDVRKESGELFLGDELKQVAARAVKELLVDLAQTTDSDAGENRWLERVVRYPGGAATACGAARTVACVWA